MSRFPGRRESALSQGGSAVSFCPRLQPVGRGHGVRQSHLACASVMSRPPRRTCLSVRLWLLLQTELKYAGPAEVTPAECGW